MKKTGKNIILGVTGSIAAYKAADIARKLAKNGHNVQAILTKNGSRFITAETLETLTGNKVYEDTFDSKRLSRTEHIALAKKADIAVVAPATANLIAKAAVGIADDMLTTVMLALKNTPVLIAPAMNTAMYENPITQRNIRSLTEFGFEFIEPREAELACSDTGKGALAQVDDIIDRIGKVLQQAKEQ